MRKFVGIILFSILALFIDTASAIEVTLFAPNQYTCFKCMAVCPACIEA